MSTSYIKRARPLVKDERKCEMEYYRVVRMTLHGLDGIRLNATVSGLTICSAFIGAGLTSWQYLTNPSSFGFTGSLGYLLSLAACLLAIATGIQFRHKISMFSDFIKCSVEIAKDLEDSMIYNDKHKLTKRFDEENEHAGKGGDKLFQLSLSLLIGVAGIGAVISAWAILCN